MSTGLKRSIYLANNSGVTVYVQFDGSPQSNLTTTTGYPIPSGTGLAIIPGVGGVEGSFPVYGIVAAGTSVVTAQVFNYSKQLP